MDGLKAYDFLGLLGTPILTNFEMVFATFETDFPSVQGFNGVMGLSNN
jgi:hypothetical protein